MENETSYKILFSRGETVILKLSCDDIFEGEICDLGVNRIDLVKARQHNNDNKLSGVYSFYRTEIDSIKLLKEKETEKQSTPECKNIEDNLNSVQLSDSEYERLREMTREFVYIDKPDSRYFKAVELLESAETIGVTGLGLEKSRTASLKILVISTWDKIYLFDFVPHKQSYFYPEIKDILQAEATCKVIHEAGPLIDILYRKYKVYVKNVFDTQVVDLIIRKKETGDVPAILSDVSDLLIKYLNFPSSFLNKALETTNTKWAERPLSDRRKAYAAQLNCYLITLKDHMQKILFAEVYEAMDKIHNYYYYLDCFQFSKNWQERAVPSEIKNLIPNFSILDISK